MCLCCVILLALQGNRPDWPGILQETSSLRFAVHEKQGEGSLTFYDKWLERSEISGWHLLCYLPIRLKRKAAGEKGIPQLLLPPKMLTPNNSHQLHLNNQFPTHSILANIIWIPGGVLKIPVPRLHHIQLNQNWRGWDPAPAFLKVSNVQLCLRTKRLEGVIRVEIQDLTALGALIYIIHWRPNQIMQMFRLAHIAYCN